MTALVAVIPAYGKRWLTLDVLRDLDRERRDPAVTVRVVVVDNKGDFTLPTPAGLAVDVLVPGQNLGWAAGTNAGAQHGAQYEPDAFVLLNNDTRLSLGFLHGLIRAWKVTGAGVIGPRYDRGWPVQLGSCEDDARTWVPADRHGDAPFVDGTCMFVTATLWARLGGLRSAHFGMTGWGADFDLCLRAREAGERVVVTDAAFLNHFRGTTAEEVHGDLDAYDRLGNEESERGMADLWGTRWRARLQTGDESAPTPDGDVRPLLGGAFLAPRDRYLLLLSRCLRGLQAPKRYARIEPPDLRRRAAVAVAQSALRRLRLDVARPLTREDRESRLLGPGDAAADVRCSLRTLDRVRACVDMVDQEAVEGSLIELGSWRGGLATLLRASSDVSDNRIRRSVVAMVEPRRFAQPSRSRRRVRETLDRYGFTEGDVTIIDDIRSVEGRIAFAYANRETATTPLVTLIAERVPPGGWLLAEVEPGSLPTFESLVRAASAAGEVEEIDKCLVAWQRAAA